MNMSIKVEIKKGLICFETRNLVMSVTLSISDCVRTSINTKAVDNLVQP